MGEARIKRWKQSLLFLQLVRMANGIIRSDLRITKKRMLKNIKKKDDLKRKRKKIFASLQEPRILREGKILI